MPRFKSRPPHFPRVLLLLATGITAQRFSSILFGSSAESVGRLTDKVLIKQAAN
jgi:hypothetical protein